MVRLCIVGGSNCIQKEGFGDQFHRIQGVEVENRSLGNSSSLRGVDFLLRHAELVEKSDKIIFEYTLNDLIFEVGNTLDPQAHLNWLRLMSSQEHIKSKLSFVLLHGKNVIPRLNACASFVWKNYVTVSNEYGIPLIDMRKPIHQLLRTVGFDGVYKGNDHFTPDAARELASQAFELVSGSLTTKPDTTSSCPPRAEELIVLDMADVGVVRGGKRRTLRTALLKEDLLSLVSGSGVVFDSPGGVLLGFYAEISQDSGCISIRHNGRKTLKSLKRMRPVAKSYLALRHFTMPINTKPGDKIEVEFHPDVYSVPDGVLDNTSAQDLTVKGSHVDIGKFIFSVAR